MKYYIIEGVPDGTYNAASKARLDAEKIFKKMDLQEFYVKTKNGIQNNKFMKWKQLLYYCYNYIVWNKSLSKLKKNDLVVIQYPLINTTFCLKRAINKFKKKGIVFVALIHDLDSLRYTAESQGKFLYKRVVNEDKYVLNEFNYIIAHNNSMKSELLKMNNSEENIVVLELFDYLLDKEPTRLSHKKNEPLIIAGNLSVEKAQYLSELKKIKGVKFNLFGVGFSDLTAANNIHYKGKFLPDELLSHLEGSFGVVWDGVSIDTCKGGFGEYLKYNNPHKVSLYLTAGIPVIVWSKSALADFVIKNEVGIVVNSLKELKECLNKITEKQYNTMVNNANKISKKTKNGEYLMESLNKIFQKI